MGQERTYYDRIFKENAVKLSYERNNVSELARELNIARHMIYRYRKEFEKFLQGSFSGNGVIKMPPKEKELADLKERMRKLELENKILKKQYTSFQVTVSIVFLTMPIISFFTV